MTLPSLDGWMQTAKQLHIAAEFLGVIQVVLMDHQPNYLEFALEPLPAGLSTAILPNGGRVILDFSRAALIYRHHDSVETGVPLNNTTHARAFGELLVIMSKADAAPLLASVAEERLLSAMFDALHAKGHHLLDDSIDTLESVVFDVDTALAADYARVLYAMFTGLARFRARLNGHMTPMVVWTEHFDLSTLWFVDGDMDDHKPHMNFGFAPFSTGFPRPYLYAYAYPYPANSAFVSLPAPARWHNEGWTGVVVDYDDILRSPQPEIYVEQMCLGIFSALRPLLQQQA
ncbi:MAG: DUF5996 family protein [Chloroflexota bacterium]|nr:DUF5996 family protein [Chloroflexota bacterium]